MNNTNRLNGKDLMNVGIFTALYVVIGIVIACTIGLIPLGFLGLTIIEPVITGIPMMLYFTKIKKFGMLFITMLIQGIMMIVTGMGPQQLIVGVPLAIIAELILKGSNYKSKKCTVLAYSVVSVSIVVNYFGFLFASEQWLIDQTDTYGTDYVNIVSGYFNYSWMFPLLIVLSLIGGLIGGLLGQSVLKKHFIRSGLI